MSSFFNATITLVDPLVIRRDAEIEPLPVTPDSLIPKSSLAEGDRVMVLLQDKTLTIIGKHHPTQ